MLENSVPSNEHIPNILITFVIKPKISGEMRKILPTSPKISIDGSFRRFTMIMGRITMAKMKEAIK